MDGVYVPISPTNVCVWGAPQKAHTEKLGKEVSRHCAGYRGRNQGWPEAQIMMQTWHYKKKAEAGMDRRAPDCSAELADAGWQSQPTNAPEEGAPVPERARPSHHTMFSHWLGLLGRPGPPWEWEADPAGWQLPARLAAEQQVAFPSKHRLPISKDATAFKHLCRKIAKSNNNFSDIVS